MTIYNWSAITPGQNLGTLTTADQINFDNSGITPSEYSFLGWDGAGLVTINAGGKQFSFTITGGGRALTDANFTFTSSSAGKVLIGDNTASIGNGSSTFDDAANNLDTSAAGNKNDRFFGLGGNDTMNGGGGDDVFILGNGAGAFGSDSVVGGTNGGNGDFLGIGTNNFTGTLIDFGSHVVSSASGTATFSGIENAFGSMGDDEIWAFEASRVFTGRNFNPVSPTVFDFTRTMDGLAGNDLIVGDQRDGMNDRVRYIGSPNAVYVNLAEEYALDGYDQDTVTGGIQSFEDTLRFIDDINGSNFNDTLLGGGLGTAGGGFFAENFEGMAGNDLIDGNGGHNIAFNFFASPNGIVFDLAAGTVQDGWDSNSTLAGVQSYVDTIVGGTTSTSANASNFADLIQGDDTRNFFQGRGGNDTLDGRGGLDTAVFYYFQSPDTLNGVGVNVDLANAVTADLSAWGLGIDTLISIEGLRGGDMNDTLRGQNNVDNELDGRAGNDLLDGRTGNDRVRYDNSPAAVNINLGGNTASDGLGFTDTLASIENARGSRFGDTITGSAVANGVEGFTGADSMDGLGGVDTLEFRFSPAGIVVDLSLAAGSVVAEDGWGFADVWAANFENVMGGVGADQITGTGTPNRLDGGQGADTLAGGLGNDTLVVDDEGDVLITDTGGTDTVESLIDFTLPTSFENLTLLPASANKAPNPSGLSDPIRGTGNSVKNIIIGNDAANVIDGKGGNDDMRGGRGNDVYIVQQALDLVKENPGEGVDTVKASLSFTLGLNVENLILTGTGDNDGAGNDRGNKLTGNAGINALDGAGGNDTLVGGAGADELSGGDGNDQFIWDAADTMVDGGFGSQDRLIVQGGGTALNLNVLNGGILLDVEVFDIHGAGNNSLTVSAATANTMGDLTVFGNAGDGVTLSGAGTWTQNLTDLSYQGHIFHIWSNDLNETEVLIETAITVGQT